jgi:copper(I)-binding protein
VTARGLTLLAALAWALALPAYAVDIELKSAWMRPGAKGDDARAYVDIVSDAPLRLVGATTPAAKRVQLVRVENTDGTDPGKVVKSFPVTPGTPMRLAYKGSHLRLVGLREDAVPGRPVPVTLQFTDAKGKRYSAKTDLTVRGLFVEPPPPPAQK